jgi:putative DNA primase/helicase
MTLFYSCRLKLIPFKRHFEEHEQDKGLKSFFAEETNLSAIFNWCYEGYKRFRAEGLEDPDAVTTATKEYEAESDRVGQFVDAWLEEGEAFEERTSAVYRLYGQWCDKYGYRKENSTNFNNAIQRFFPIVRKRPSDGSGGPTTMLVGCRFLKHENGEQDHAATEDEGAFS